jgi:hypothetical protein
MDLQIKIATHPSHEEMVIIPRVMTPKGGFHFHQHFMDPMFL